MSESKSYTEIYRDFLSALHGAGILAVEAKTRLEIALKNKDWNEVERAQKAVIELRKII